MQSVDYPTRDARQARPRRGSMSRFTADLMAALGANDGERRTFGSWNPSVCEDGQPKWFIAPPGQDPAD